MSNKVFEKVRDLQTLIGTCFDNARKADSGFVTAGIRLRKQMKEVIEGAMGVRKSVIEARKEKE